MMQNNIKYANAQYFASPGLDLKDLKMEEDWSGRPASKWSVQKIGQLQAKIDKFSYSIYHSKWYGKRNLSNLIPGHILRQFANEVFGYDGWKMDLQYVDVRESLRPGLPTKHNVLAEAQVKITLKDGTNLQAGGIGCATMNSKGECYGKAKKQAVNDAFKKAMLGFEQVILAHETRVKNGYYVDGLYSSKVEKENRY
ncbi:RAD59 (YDL059C) [Zygosaccharomyces parabailii]|nr:RAD59 (YDL059C) [Zygosaccharomyces parabailii]